jgi:hypothetical protein
VVRLHEVPIAVEDCRLEGGCDSDVRACHFGSAEDVVVEEGWCEASTY